MNERLLELLGLWKLGWRLTSMPNDLNTRDSAVIEEEQKLEKAFRVALLSDTRFDRDASRQWPQGLSGWIDLDVDRRAAAGTPADNPGRSRLGTENLGAWEVAREQEVDDLALALRKFAILAMPSFAAQLFASFQSSPTPTSTARGGSRS